MMGRLYFIELRYDLIGGFDSPTSGRSVAITHFFEFRLSAFIPADSKRLTNLRGTPIVLDDKTKSTLISLIESVQSDLLAYESFVKASREALNQCTSEFAQWYGSVVLDSIEDHGYWASPFASYTELADLSAIAYALRGGNTATLLAHEDFGAYSERHSSIATTFTSNEHEAWDRSSRLKYLTRVLEAVQRNPGVASLNESLPNVVDFDDSSLEPSEIEARNLLRAGTRRGCVLPFLSLRPTSSWLEAMEKTRVQLLIESEK